MELKKGQISFSADAPMEISFNADESATDVPEHLSETFKRLSETIKEYLKAAEELLREQYSSTKHLVPLHLSSPGNVLIAWCEDGIVIRYERRIGESKRSIGIGWELGGEARLSRVVPLVSQSLVHCHPNKDAAAASRGQAVGIELILSKTDAKGVPMTDFLKLNLSFHAVIEKPVNLPVPPNKPYCLLAVHNDLPPFVTPRPTKLTPVLPGFGFDGCG